MRLHKFLKIILLTLIVILSFPRRVHAYLDPGTGSFIIQLIIGATLGGGYMIKTQWKKIISFLKRNRDDKKQDTKK